MIVRASFFVFASAAALAVSRTSARTARKPSPTVDTGHADEEHSCKEEEKKTEDHAFLDAEIKEEGQVKVLTDKTKEDRFFVGNSESLINELKQRKMSLESRLIELYALKEEASYVARLRKELTAKTNEIDELGIVMGSIRGENEILKDNVQDGCLAVKRLEAADNLVKELQGKMALNKNRLKGQLEMLETQVSRIRETQDDSPVVREKLDDFSGLVLEVLKMKRKNKELELERRELVILLNAARTRVSNPSKTIESNAICRISEEANALRSSNEELLEQVENLQKHRFGMVEELVYQRWLTSCLRFEIQSYQRIPETSSKTCRISDTDSSSQSQESSTSSRVSGSVSTSTLSSSGTESSITKKISFAHKLKKWGRSQIDSSKSFGLVRRFSTSIVPSDTFKLRKRGNAKNEDTVGSGFLDSPETPMILRRRRVSFSDVVRKLEPDFEETVSQDERECDKPEMNHPEQDSLEDLDAVYACDMIPSSPKKIMITEKDVDIIDEEEVNCENQTEAGKVQHAPIQSYPSKSTITTEVADTGIAAVGISSRYYNGFCDQIGLKLHIVKLIGFIFVFIFLILQLYLLVL